MTDAEGQDSPAAALLDYHLGRRDAVQLGRGADFYSPAPEDHPMAYAMYARAFLNLFALRRRPEDLANAQALLQRLGQLSAGDGAWGLRVSWRGTGADEPYAITTAICLLAYLDLYGITADEAALRAAGAAARWLGRRLPWQEGPLGRGPQYSPTMRYVLSNVTAMVGGALARFHAATGCETSRLRAIWARDRVLAEQDRLGFWCYGSAGQEVSGGLDPALTVDALHTGYTLDGCIEIGCARLDDGRLSRAVGRGFDFVARYLIDRNGRCAEKVVPLPDSSSVHVEALSNPRLSRIRADDGRTMIGFPQESRLWGYGALLGAAARALSLGWLSTAAPIERMLSRLLSVHFSSSAGRFAYLPGDPRAFPRHEAHAAEGVSAWLERGAALQG